MTKDRYNQKEGSKSHYATGSIYMELKFRYMGESKEPSLKRVLGPTEGWALLCGIGEVRWGVARSSRQWAMLRGPCVSLGRRAYRKEVIPGCSFKGTMGEDSYPYPHTDAHGEGHAGGFYVLMHVRGNCLSCEAHMASISHMTWPPSHWGKCFLVVIHVMGSGLLLYWWRSMFQILGWGFDSIKCWGRWIQGKKKFMEAKWIRV